MVSGVVSKIARPPYGGLSDYCGASLNVALVSLREGPRGCLSPRAAPYFVRSGMRGGLVRFARHRLPEPFLGACSRPYRWTYTFAVTAVEEWPMTIERSWSVTPRACARLAKAWRS